jgi:hypothetical protein
MVRKIQIFVAKISVMIMMTSVRGVKIKN